MDYRELFANVAKRPRMYGLDGSDAAAVAFVSGVQAATSGLALTGFREWLQVRLGEVSSLAFDALVARTGQDLFGCLDEFLAVRDSGHGLESIYDAYLELLRSEGLYDSHRQRWPE
ncbi:MAG: hypothetical protein ACRDT6_11760 [Micromonosporaceae bacterium]